MKTQQSVLFRMSPHNHKQVLFVYGIPASLKLNHAKYILLLLLALESNTAARFQDRVEH